MTRVEQQITGFDETVSPSRASMYMSTDVPSPYPTESIKEWLSRPYPLGTYEWATSDAVGDLIASFLFPGDLLTIQSLWDKVSHFSYFRASVRVTIRMNGTRTHYGKLLMMWSPYPTYDTRHFDLTSNIYSATGYPHVICSPTEPDVVEVVVPFISPMVYGSPNPGFFQSFENYFGTPFGGVYIYVLNPLKSINGSNTVNFSIYANFEDVQISGYTARNLPKPDPSVRAVPTKARSPIEVPSEFVAQAQKTTRSTNMLNPIIASEAKAKASAGVVSSVLEKVGSVAATMTTVPYVGNFSALVAPVAFGLSRMASYFGYCRPDTVRGVSPVGMKYLDTAPTHGEDPGNKLALLPDNSVNSALHLLGGLNEMSFDYICSRPMLINITEWASSRTPGSTLITIPVIPTYIANDQFSTYLSWVSKAFQYWRGDLRYHVQITASAFHSGRIRISYDPNDSVSSLTDPQAYADCASRLIDIQSETDVSFTIPYLSPYPYRSTSYTPSFGSAPSTGDIGRLLVSVVNPLVASVDPVPSIYINVFVSGVNMSFGAPRLVSIAPNESEFVAQALTSTDIMSKDYTPIIPSVTSSISGLCFGEDADSVKDLAARPCPAYYYNDSDEPASVNSGADNNYVYYDLEDADTTVAPLEFGALAPGLYYWNASNSPAPLTPNDKFIGIRVYNSEPGADPNELFLCTVRTQVAASYGLTGYVIIPSDGTWDSIIISAETGTFTLLGAVTFLKMPDATVPPSLEQPDTLTLSINAPLFVNYELDPPLGTNAYPTYLSYFAAIFRFWRGSIRYKLLETAGDSVTLRSVHLEYERGADVPYFEQKKGKVSVNSLFHTGFNSVRTPVSNALEITVPYYHNYISHIVRAYSTAQQFVPYDTILKVVFNLFRENSTASKAVAGVITASAGDDFEFGFLVPPPSFSLA